MTATPVAELLLDLARCGIHLESDPDDPGALRYRPRARMTVELADRLKDHKGEVLAILRDPTCTSDERKILQSAPEGLRVTIDLIKTVFADVGSTVISVRRDPTRRRRQAARLIRQARARGHHRQAVAIRDAWHERVAICTIDGGLSEGQAEAAALTETRAIPYA